MNRQKQILAILLVVLALVGVRAFITTPRQVEVEPSAQRTTRTANSGEQAHVSAAANTPRVKLDSLDPAPEKYQGYKRDIFNFYVPKPKPKPVVKPKPKPVVQKPKPKPVVTPQVRQQLAKFTFLGFLIKKEERTIFLSKRDELFLVKRADTFGENDQFEVIDITEEKLTIQQSGAGGLIEIDLVEKEPLIPSFSTGSESQGVEKSSSPPEQNVVPQREQRKPWFKKTQSPADQ